MQEKASKRPKRKYGIIKKTFVSVEAAEEEKKKNVCSIEEKLKKINVIKTLKVDTPWTTGSSDEGANGYMYYRIQQAKKNAKLNPKYSRIFDFLDIENVSQLDFNGVVHCIFHRDQGQRIGIVKLKIDRINVLNNNLDPFHTKDFTLPAPHKKTSKAKLQAREILSGRILEIHQMVPDITIQAKPMF